MRVWTKSNQAYVYHVHYKRRCNMTYMYTEHQEMVGSFTDFLFSRR